MVVLAYRPQENQAAFALCGASTSTTDVDVDDDVPDGVTTTD